MNLGGFIRFPMKFSGAIKLDVCYSQKGWSGEGSVRLNYIDLVPQYLFPISQRMSFLFGIYSSIFISGWIHVDSDQIATSDENTNSTYSGATIGGSYSIGKIFIEAKYLLGLSESLTDGNFPTDGGHLYGSNGFTGPMKSRVAQVNIGYLF